AGTAHAIGPGLLIAEIQTPSDTTYRIFDWSRVDDTGKARQLHIEEALESIHFDARSDNLSVTTGGRLVDCKYFKIDKGTQAKGRELLLSPGKMKTLIILTGSGTIPGAEGNTVDLVRNSTTADIRQKQEISNGVEFKAGDTLLVPAVYEGAIRFADDTQYLIITI
ncbi:unnamed protein product, partial [marine sediment metagenome]